MGKAEAQNKILRLADIHETAVVHPEAEIAKDVEIGPYSVIGENVSLGTGTFIGPHVRITGRTTIGRNNKIYHGAVIGIKPGNNGESGEKSFVFIGENNVIRENVTIMSGTAETRIGNGNLIMAYCHLACNCQAGNHTVITNSTNLGTGVTVEDHAVIAGLSAIHPQVRIGKISMVGAHSRIVNDVPPYVLVDGSPAHINGINVIGLRRNGIKPGLRREIKRAYKILYRSGLSMKEAIKKMDQELDASEEIEHFLRFLRNVQRGICR